jgi:hypothetical protein
VDAIKSSEWETLEDRKAIKPDGVVGVEIVMEFRVEKKKRKKKFGWRKTCVGVGDFPSLIG